MSNQGYDDDKPKDGKYHNKSSTRLKGYLPAYNSFSPIEFIFFTRVFKLEEKKILANPRWEQITAVYW